MRDDPFNEAEFIDDPSVPQYPIEGIHEVEIRGSICEIIPFSYHRTAGGLWIKQASHTCIVPLSAVPSMVLLVGRKIGMHGIGYMADATSRALHLH